MVENYPTNGLNLLFQPAKLTKNNDSPVGPLNLGQWNITFVPLPLRASKTSTGESVIGGSPKKLHIYQPPTSCYLQKPNTNVLFKN